MERPIEGGEFGRAADDRMGSGLFNSGGAGGVSVGFQGHLTHVFKPGGINLTNTYDQLGRLITVSDSLGSTTNNYDNLSRLTTSSNYAGLVYRAYYDDHNLVRTNIDANGVQTILTYDDLHRLRTRAVSGSGTESFGYTADTSGPTSYTNQLGKVTTFAYHAAGWKTNEVIVGMATNRFTYDAAGNLCTLSDGKNQLTSWGYDTYGRVTSKTNDNSTLILSYLYDANGRLTNRWSAAKGNTVYRYDAVGSLTNVAYAASPYLHYAYDALGRMTSMADASGTTTWTYDLTNRFVVEDGPWASDNVTNRWNTAGLRESMAVQQPSASTYFNTAYAYDAAKRVTNITSGAGSYTYVYHPGLNGHDAASRLVMMLALPNSSYIDNYHDSAGRLTGTYLMKSDTISVLNSHQYVYNVGNQRTKQTFTDGSYNDYLYDDAGQLYSSKAYSSVGSPVGTQNRGYEYDPAWNMTARTNNTTVSAYTVNALNQVTGSPAGPHGHDLNGNMTSAGLRTWYGYDDENQLTLATFMASDWSSGWKTEFMYDGKMRLRKQVDYSWNSSGGTNGMWSAGTERRFIYDGMLVAQERNGSNVPGTSYTRGPDLSGTWEGAGGIGGLLGRSMYSAAAQAWVLHHHYHADGNGNITYLVNSSQGLGALYKYDPYGNLISSGGAFVTLNLYRFSSKMYVNSPGLYYYGYRFYSPALQRWVNRDPIQELGGMNLYRYVGGNAISRIDPLGLFSIWDAIPIIGTIQTCLSNPGPYDGNLDECECKTDPTAAEAACEQRVDAQMRNDIANSMKANLIQTGIDVIGIGIGAGVGLINPIAGIVIDGVLAIDTAANAACTIGYAKDARSAANAAKANCKCK